LDTVPARTMPETALCIASKASDLKLFFRMAYFLEFADLQLLYQGSRRFLSIKSSEFAKRSQFIVCDIGSIVLANR